MPKCYSCGSTAQVKTETLRIDDGIMEIHSCGCGCVTRTFYTKKFVDIRVYGTLIYREGERK